MSAKAKTESKKIAAQRAAQAAQAHAEYCGAIYGAMIAHQSLGDSIKDELVRRYGAPLIKLDAKGVEISREGGPSLADYRADQKALAALAKADGKTDQYVRKTYARMIRETYGAIPLSDKAGAARQRASAARKAAAQAAKNPPTPTAPAVAGKAGRKAGETQERQPSAEEAAESKVTKDGMYQSAYAVCRIMETNPQQAEIAKKIRALVDMAYEIDKRQREAARAAAVRPPVLSAETEAANVKARASARKTLNGVAK